MCWNVNEVKCDKIPEVSIDIKKINHHSDLCVNQCTQVEICTHMYTDFMYLIKKKVKLNPHKLTL